jgi:hypothetical protein
LPHLNKQFKFLTAFFINQICPAIRGDFKRFKSIYVSQIPIIDATESQRTAIEKLVQKCLDAKKRILTLTQEN